MSVSLARDVEATHAGPRGLCSAPVGVGVIGLGYAGRHHLERLNLRDDFRVVAGSDLSETAARKAAGLVPRTFSNWRHLLDDDAIGLVIIATPPATHAELAIAALQAGRHVLVETPLSLEVADADAMLAAAEGAGRSLVVAPPAVVDRDFLTARTCLRSGMLGSLLAIKHISWQYSPDRQTHRVADKANDPGDWRRRSNTGGGALWEFGAERLEQLLQLVDEPPTKVFATLYGGRSGDPEEGFLLVVRFPSGIVAHLEACRAYPAPIWLGWTIAGTQGSFAGGSHYSVTGEGEVVDVPVSQNGVAGDEFYEGLARHLIYGSANSLLKKVSGTLRTRDDPLESTCSQSSPHLFQQAANPGPVETQRKVVATLAAARRSAETGVPEAVS